MVRGPGAGQKYKPQNHTNAARPVIMVVRLLDKSQKASGTQQRDITRVQLLYLSVVLLQLAVKKKKKE